jgi:hypothetical protein
VPGSTLRNRRWLRGWGSWEVGCLARRLALLAAVPGSWCVVVPAVEADAPAWAGSWADVVFAFGAFGFAFSLVGSLLLAYLAGRLAAREHGQREASWSALSERTRARREVVEGATARLGGSDLRQLVRSGVRVECDGGPDDDVEHFARAPGG